MSRGGKKMGAHLDIASNERYCHLSMPMFSFGTVFGRALSTFGQHFWPFTLIAAMIQLPTIIANGWLLSATKEIERLGPNVQPDDLQEMFAPAGVVMLLQLVLTPLATAAVTYGVMQHMRGLPVAFSECVNGGLSRMVPVIGVGIVAGLAIAGGTLACCIPGIVLSCGYYLAAPVAVVEGGGVMDSLRRSWALTDGAKGTIFAILLCVGIGSGVLGNMIALPFKGSSSEGAMAAHFFLSGIVLALTSAFGATLAATAYHDLRLDKEGASTDVVGPTFD